MPEPQTWLLLVGINFYLEKANQLQGAINDVTSMKLSMTEYYKEVNVTKLLASVTGNPGQTAPPEDKHLWPTWDNFTSKIKDITQRASAGDIVWIHYSGHGTLQSTKTSEFTYQEGSGIDAALVLWEPNSSHGVRYLRGIELAILLDDMVNKGLKLTVILDSCHSGSISRKSDYKVRGIPWSVKVDNEFPLHEPVLPQFLASKENNLRDAAVTSHWLLHPHGYTLLAACGSHELAKEIQSGGRQHGALSYLICKAFYYYAQNRIENVTHELIYRRVYAEMFRVGEQHPILIGTDKSTLRGAEVGRLHARSTFEIIKVSADQEIRMNAGFVHGACTGDEYEVYVHTEAKELVSRITIIDVEAVHSIAKYTSAMSPEADAFQIKVGYRAILTKLAKPRAYVKLFFEANDSWEESLKESIWLQHLPSNELASVDIPCFSVRPDRHQYIILDTKGDVILNLPPLVLSNPCVSKQTFTILEHLSKYTFVQALDNRRTNSLNDSEFTITVKKQADHLDSYKPRSSITIPHDSKLSIKFQNLTQEVLYFTVLNLTPLRQIKRLYPKHKEDQSVLPRDPQKVLPKNMPEDMVRTIAPPGMDRLEPRFTVPARLRAQQQGSVGAEDVLKFIVSTYPIRGTKSLELPDLWDAVEYAVRSADETFGAGMQTSLVEKSQEPGQGGEKPSIRWTCRSIIVHTVLEVK